MGLAALVLSALNACVASGLLLPWDGDFVVDELGVGDLEGDDPTVDPWSLRSGNLQHPYQAESPDFYVKLQDEMTERHAAVTKSHAGAQHGRPPPPKSIDIAFSLTEGADLPAWAHDILSGSWGIGLSLTVYVKTDGLGRDEEVVLERRRGFEKVAIANLGRNEHAYVKHLARRYNTFPDVQILTKTNDVSPEMIRSMVDANRNGSYGFISHPWKFQRRYLTVRCDSAWENHALFPEFCHGNTVSGTIRPVKELPGWLVIRPARVQPDYCDLSWPLFNRQGRLPFLHEAHGEGTFSIRRDVLAQFPHDWYLTWSNLTYKCAIRSYMGKHHDDAMMEVFPLVFSKERYMSDFPVYHISPSTVVLCDRR